ncbi:hypothetical protein LTS08_002272 [Lithohypha guttulata]|nr:hypothetical protein LTS08_002272 [Lithohypha guttulata]
MSSAVDNLADNLQKASIDDQTIATDAATASAAEGRRLYIGNLAYATTEEELKQFFSGYDVESTSIPVNPRTNRPVGYAFVDLKQADDAQKAIENLSGKEILERKVSVQLARKPDAEAPKTEDGQTAQRKRSSGRGRGGRGRGRGGRAAGGRTKSADATETADATPAETEVLPLTDKTNEANQGEVATDGKTRQPRQPKQRGPPEDGIPSSTKVMVANLPYDLTEEKLKELFAEFNPVSAKIALRPIPRFMIKKLQARNEPRKGRGFGFVNFESEAQQQKAVSEMNGKQIEGREIAVKVAIDSPGKEDGAEHVEDGTNGTTEEVAAA